MDEEEYFQPVLTSVEEEIFQKLETVPAVSISLAFGILLEITGIAFVSVWPEEQNKCDTYFIYLYLHCVHWLIVMAADYYVKAKHHQLRISSLWNTCYLLLAVILHQTHKVNYEDYCRASEWLTPLNYIVLLTTLELIIIVPIYVNYIKRVLRFNRSRPPPDVARDEWLSSFTQDTYAGSGEVGYRHRGSNLDELLEKQADLIRYLRDHNVKLSHRIMLLAAQRRIPDA